MVVFLVFALAPRHLVWLFSVPAVPALLGAFELDRLKKRIARNNRVPGTGLFSSWLRRDLDAHGKVYNKAAFEEAIRLRQLPLRRWLLFRRLAEGFLILCFAGVVVRSLS